MAGDYKAAAERTDESERLLTRPFKHTMNDKPEDKPPMWASVEEQEAYWHRKESERQRLPKMLEEIHDMIQQCPADSAPMKVLIILEKINNALITLQREVRE